MDWPPSGEHGLNHVPLLPGLVATCLSMHGPNHVQRYQVYTLYHRGGSWLSMCYTLCRSRAAVRVLTMIRGRCRDRPHRNRSPPSESKATTLPSLGNPSACGSPPPPLPPAATHPSTVTTHPQTPPLQSLVAAELCSLFPTGSRRYRAAVLLSRPPARARRRYHNDSV